MKKELNAAAIFIILFSTISCFAMSVETTMVKDELELISECFDVSSKLGNISPDAGKVQDGRFITNLQWFSPNGELPGTYEEYLSMHPLKPACFTHLMEVDVAPQSKGDTISILVDNDLYKKIKTSINEYILDLIAEGYSVFLESVSGGSPEEIKAWVKDRYNSGSTGIVFVGDITAAWAEVSDSVFPCDLFYMDLDGNWEDQDEDGDYEIHTSSNGDMGPEVYVGRIYAHTLTYDTESNMVNDYLAKCHMYRTGELTQPWRGLEYIDEDWYDMDVYLDFIYGDDVVRHDYGYNTTGADYLDQMDLGQHFVQVCAHSYSGGHHFGTRPTESASYAHVYVYSPNSRSAKLLLGCDDGIKVWLNSENVYTNDRYGGWYEDAYEADVSLNSGWNQLLCKISQGGGDYKFSVRFTDINYNTFDDLEYQINDPDLYGAEAEFIRSWLLNGFHQDIPDNFYNYLTTNYLGEDESSINPEEDEVMGGKKWTCYDSGNPYINLGDYCDDADYGVCFAFVRVYANSDKSCQLWMGYDDGARVWLNGEVVIHDNRYGGFEADMTKADVDLQAGENRLLVKISEWMGEHGFSARFCLSDGSPVNGLTYDPNPTPVAHIGTWLINGPYVNPDQATRLSTDYLGDEANVTPIEGDPAPVGTWERGIGDGCPFNLGRYFDHGDWVFSNDIQSRDPPVLFYNLFACGPGRFTDENYLAGAYIFHTSYGLISVASSKSGSMLNFDDFTRPFSEGKSIGEAFREWFDAQAPFQQWEKEWYYGMVVCGDPTLYVIKNGHPNIPTITGPTSGKVGNPYTYTFTSTDPDGDDVSYYIKWGDGNVTDWTSFQASGPPGYTEAHAWDEQGTYIIEAKAKDINGTVSDWAELTVIMPRNRANFNRPFLNFLKQYSYKFPVLWHILGL